MKNKYLSIKTTIVYLFVLCMVLFSCKEEPIGQQPIDGDAPASITDVKVENTPGGAVLTYQLPDDEDLLYIKAIYQLKDGVNSETRASIYSDTLRIEGFGDTSEREVMVYAVDRSRNESDPISVTIAPLEPSVITIGKSLKLTQDFGGVKATWENPTKADVAIVIMTEDENQEYIPIETFYSSVVSGKGSIVGMDTITYNWKAYIEDRWENRSTAIYDTIAPLFETEFEPAKFKAVNLADDATAWETWTKDKMWNGIWGTDEGFSSLGGTGVWPQSVTVDLGVVGKISRFRLFQRMGDYLWSEGNLRKFKIYGSTEPSSSWDDWTLLMDCESIKPSGQPLGITTDEDYAVALNGEDFYNDPANPAVRYIRILVTRTWAGGDNFQITEFKVYGDNR